jgi:hypothetical protein
LFVLLAIAVKMEHCWRDKLTEFWAKMDQFYTLVWSNMMWWNRYLHVLRFLNFTGNINEADGTEGNYSSYLNCEQKIF